MRHVVKAQAVLSSMVGWLCESHASAMLLHPILDFDSSPELPDFLELAFSNVESNAIDEILFPFLNHLTCQEQSE